MKAYSRETKSILGIGLEKAVECAWEVDPLLMLNLLFDPREKFLMAWKDVSHKCGLFDLAVILFVVPPIGLDKGAQRR